MPEDPKNTKNETQAGSSTEPQTSTFINPLIDPQNPANDIFGNIFPVSRIARMRIASSPRYRIKANTRQEAAVLMNEIGQCTQMAVRTCYSQKTFTQGAYESMMQNCLTNPKITVVSYGVVEKIDQFGNPWEDWMDAPGGTADAGLAEPQEVYGPPKPQEVYGPPAQWELKSQVNDDVLKFTRYSDGRCIVEVILPKEKGRSEDQYHVYSITDSVRELIDNPENSEYGLDKDALTYINYGKEAFDEYYKNGKIFPPLSAGSDEYYALVLYNMRHGEAWVKDWNQTFEDAAAFNIIAGAVMGAVPGASGAKTPKGASGAKTPKGASGAETPKRPSWRQSEIDAQKSYPDYEPQKSFKNGKEVPYGTKGSTRPELYKPGHSIEVKNYKVETPSGQSNLVNNVSKQIQSRTPNLPSGTKQTVIVDVRGQTVSNTVLKSIRSRILEKSGVEVEIIFKR